MVTIECMEPGMATMKKTEIASSRVEITLTETETFQMVTAMMSEVVMSTTTTTAMGGIESSQADSSGMMDSTDMMDIIEMMDKTGMMDITGMGDRTGTGLHLLHHSIDRENRTGME